MNFQSYSASGNFSCCVLVPMGRRMTSLLGRWYYVLSTAFNKILLSKSHGFPELIAGFFHFGMEHTEAGVIVGGVRRTWEDHHGSKGSADWGTVALRNRWSHRGFLASAISQKLHSAEKRGVEENVTLGLILHPPSRLLCWVGAGFMHRGICHRA